MKIKAMNGVLLAMLILPMVACVSTKKFDALQAEKDALAASLASVEAQVKQLQQQNEKLNMEKNQLSEDLSGVKKQLNDTETRVAAVQGEVNDKQTQIDRLMREIRSAFSHIEGAVSSTDERIKEIEDALYIDMKDTINFRTASAAISAEDQEALTRISTMLKEHPNLHLVIEGNADKRSINNDKFKDNWELSAARSIAVVRKLIDMGVDPGQLTAAGRAEFNPTAAGVDALDQNRRIELMVMPKIGTLYKISKEK
ncbi:MAG: OmpA family protein [Saprospiraceae bacterium]|nr:OmpA family protein [Saprospiraceae bacterium]